MENKKRILYFMSVPWGWIKQRPHFLAEGLSKYYHVDVYYKKSTVIKTKNLLTAVPIDSENLVIRSFRLIPFHAMPVLKRMKLEFINRFVLKMQVPNIKSYDYVWIPSPKLFKVIAPLLSPNQRVIYDCMDDCAEFGNYSEGSFERTTILANEKLLLQRSDDVLFSAEFLKNKVLVRSGISDKRTLVVNNAIEIPDNDIKITLPDEVKEKLEIVKTQKKPLMYIGTIAEWFDFSIIEEALNNDADLSIILIGPSNVLIPKHPRIIYLGTLRRDYIFVFMSTAYALVMPFVVNELIKSVNPVKLYEYIYTGKPVIAPRYMESEKFSEFVFLYENKEVFMNCIKKAGEFTINDKYIEKCHSFLKNNTWSSRSNVITDFLENV